MCKRGDIYYVDFGEKAGSEQGGVRPALVVSNNKANKHSPVVTVIPLSARVWKKKYLPTHVQIPLKKSSGLNKPSMALAEQVETLDKTRLGERIGEDHRSTPDTDRCICRVQIRQSDGCLFCLRYGKIRL